MHPVLRSIGGVVVGLAVGSLLITGVQLVSIMVYPLPDGIDPHDIEALKALLGDIPVGALLFVLLSYCVGTFAGAAVAARIAGRLHMLHAIVVGGFFLAGGIMNLIQIPHPGWFIFPCLAIFMPSAWLGGRLVHGLAASRP